MYNGEELIEISSLNMNDQEVVSRIRSTINSIFREADQYLAAEEKHVNERISEMTHSIDRCDVDKIEKRKTVISNLLYFIGSIFSVELTPVEMFGKQKMPEEKRKKFNGLAAKAQEVKSKFEDALSTIRSFRGKMKAFCEDVLSNNEKTVWFLQSANDCFKYNRHADKSSETYFLLETLASCGMIEQDDIDNYIRNDVRFFNTQFQKKLLELNKWYVTEKRNESKTK